MLDQLSGGRFELGVGRGVSPIEVGFYGVNPADGPRQFPEALRVLLRGLTSDTLSWDGEFYHFSGVPMVLRPVQQPHPPLWYGVTAPATAHWAALERAHMVTLAPTAAAAVVIDRYKSEWEAIGHTGPLPMRGVMRHVVLAETEAAAFTAAGRAYKSWLGHMRLLWDQKGIPFTLPLPPDIEQMVESGASFVGTAAGFRAFIEQHVKAIDADYLACDVAFGDLTFDETMRTVEIVGREIIPALGAPAAGV
jgi:alkanesulfonate monooxygenase SsuD/methylene tetrahydromethanopterin reductase-like flavin-dependent oxidoreductase (luciferase family)